MKNFLSKLLDMLCYSIEYRLYENHELKVIAFRVTNRYYVVASNKENSAEVVNIDDYIETTFESWLKNHRCKKQPKHVMVYKNRIPLIRFKRRRTH